MTDPPWTSSELQILRPPNQLTIAEWADTHRVLDPVYTPGEPGAWRTDRVPYLRGIWESWQDPRVRQVTNLKCPQTSGTEAALNAIGHAIAEQPRPIVLVMPTDESAREMSERVSAMVDSSPALSRWRSDQKTHNKATRARYGGTVIYYRTAGSADALARVAASTVMVDEADKARSEVGREAGSIALARHRLRTVLDSKLLANSTPTDRTGPIWQEWERSDKREWWWPCPHCGTFQRFALDRLVTRPGAEGAEPEQIQDDGLAAYLCRECGEELHETRDKPRAMLRGVWVPEGATVTPNGTIVGARQSAHHGFHVSAFLSPWVSFSEILAKHKGARTRSERKDFVNGYLGWIFEEQIDRITLGDLEADDGAAASGEVPDGVRVITAGVDVGKRDCHYEVRGWATDRQSYVIEAGRLHGLDEIPSKILDRKWGDLVVAMTFIDAGYDSVAVYEFCRGRARVRAINGVDKNRYRVPIQRGIPERSLAGRVMGRPVLLIDTNLMKDEIADDVSQNRAHVANDVPDDWPKHMSAEHKIVDPRRGEVWVPLPGAGANHYLDAAVYSYAAAYSVGAWTIQEVAEPQRAPRRPLADYAAPASPRAAARAQYAGAGSGAGFFDRNRWNSTQRR